MVKINLKNYFAGIFDNKNLPRDFKIICGYQIILHIVDGMIGLFLPIFLLETFDQKFFWVIFFYLIGYGLYALLVPLGAMIMSKIGIKKSMILARFFAIIFYLSLLVLKQEPIKLIILANLTLLCFRLLYWVPYHTNFAQITHRDKRGRQVAYLAMFGYLASIAAPLLGGFLLSQYGFNLVFILVMIVFLFSIIPLFFLNPTLTHFDFSFLQTFKEWLKKKNSRLRIAYMADGAQDLIGVVIWPIFIFQLLEKKYMAVGAISALIIIGTIVLYLITGEYTDKIEKKKIMRYSSLFYALGWLLKTFVVTAFQIFVVGALHSFAAILLRTPFDALAYERAADHGSYVDEYTVLREISMSLGRVLMGILLIILAYFIGLQFAFLLAALVSLLINLL